MNAGEIMVKDVVAVRPETPVREIALLMLDRRISGVPVVDAERRVLGIVSEGDLIRRPEIETDHAPAGWLRLFLSDEERARLRQIARPQGARGNDAAGDLCGPGHAAHRGGSWSGAA